MSEIAVQPKRSTGLLIWMIVSQLITIVSILIWLAFSILPYAFWDDPNASTALRTAMLWCMWLSPIIPIGLSIAAWTAYARSKNWQAAVLAGLTSVPPLLLTVVLVIASLLSLVALPGY